jgi:pimeloyl-ACP methyl ester carboxylesterase
VRVVAIETLGEGPPLVLVHGVGTSRVVWRGVMPELAERHEVIAPDVPGFGGTPAAGPGFDLDVVADTLAAALPERFALVGNSLGGAIALVLAHRHPDRVSDLILAAPAGLAPHGGPIPAVAGRIGYAVGRTRRAAAPTLAGRELTRRLLLAGIVVDTSGVSAADARRMMDGSAGATRIPQAIAAVVRADLRPRLSELRMPLSFIWGDRDRVIPYSTLRALEAYAPGAPCEVLEGCGHVPQLERPADFVAAVDRLLITDR